MPPEDQQEQHEQDFDSQADAQKFWDELDEPQGDDPPAQAGAKPEPEAQVVTPDPVVQAADPRDIKPDYVSALESQVAELTNLVKASVGRVGSMQSTIDKLQAAPSKEQIAAAMKSTVKWEAMQKDFPDFAEAVDERFSALQAQPGIKPDELLSQARQFAEEKASETHIRTAKTLATLVEPDWEAVSGSKEFYSWLELQPAPVFAAAAKASAEWDAGAVVKLVRDYKVAAAKAAPARGSGSGSRQRLASATVPTGVTGARVVPESELDGEAFWDHLAKQEARQRA